MKKKYELTQTTKDFVHLAQKITLYQIRALKSFENIKKGELGGWIESEENLSQEGTSWVSENGKIFGHAEVYGRAKVFGDAIISGHAKVYEDAMVYDNAHVYGDALLLGYAHVHGYAKVYGNAAVVGGANVRGKTKVYGDAKICGSAMVCGDAKICGKAFIRDNAEISDSCTITVTSDYFVIGPIGSENDSTTFYKSDSGISVSCGCFYGTLEKFERKVKDRHHGTKYENQYLAAIVCAKSMLRHTYR